MRFTHRVYLPDGQTIGISDNTAGDERLVDLYREYGDLRLDICQTDTKGIDELEAVRTTTITKYFQETT